MDQLSIDRILATLDECSKAFETLLSRYVYHIAVSSTSLLKMMVSFLILRWHIARRTESYVRLYRAILPLLRLQLVELEREEEKELVELFRRGERAMNLYGKLVKDLEEMSKALAGKALSYVSTIVVLLIITIVPFLIEMLPEEAMLFYLQRDFVLIALMIVCITLLLFWDANLFRYVSVTTERIQDTTLMSLEISLYSRITELIQDEPIQPSRGRLFGELGFFVIAFGVLATLASYVFIAVVPSLSFLFVILALVLTAQILLIPVLFIRYAISLIRSFK